METKKKVVIVIDGGSISYIFVSPELEGLEIEIIDHDRAPKTTEEKEQLFKKYSEKLNCVHDC